MAGERRLHLFGEEDPIWRLWSQLPEPWRGPIIGDDVEGWESITENDDYRINLTGLPEVIQAELAWMAHWQAADGTRSSVLAISQLANILRRAIREDRPLPAVDPADGLGGRGSAPGMVLRVPVGTVPAAWGPGAAAGHLPVRAHRADRGLP